MKTYISYLVIALLMTNALSGQVKIGSNPETLHNASVLELESTSRVLVITRVNDAQMSAINPLRGALVYNTDHDCLHYFNGTDWINICEALDNSFTVSTRADYLSQLFPSAKDSTVVITPTENPDGSLNYNFEVNVISRDNIGASAVTSSKIQNGSIENRHMAPKSISPLKFEDGNNVGDLLRWNGTVWELTNEADISISEVDGTIGNEVVDATDATLTRLGSGTDADPYTLDVSPLGIGTAELADGAVTNPKLADNSVGTIELIDDSVTAAKIAGDVAGNGLTQAADGSLDVVVSELTGDGTLESPGSTIEITGTPTNALLENVGIDVADNAITSVKIFDGTIVTADIADNAITNPKLADNSVGTIELIDDSVTAAKIAGDVAGNGLTQAADGSLDVDALAGEVTGPTDATVIVDNAITNAKMDDNSVGTIELIDDSVTAAKIAGDVAGNGLTQAADGSLDVDALAGEVTGSTDATVIVDNAITNAKMDDNSVGTIELIDDSVTAAKIAGDVAGNGLTQAADGSLDVDALAGEVTGSTDATVIANSAVTTDKIADANVTPAKIEASLTDGDILTTIGGMVTWQQPAEATVTAIAGSVFFADGTNGVSEDNPNFFWDNTDKRLGVGTNTPTSTLQTGGSFATAILRWNGGLLDLDETHHTIIIRADSDINFPPPNTCPGRVYIIKNPAFIVTTDGYTNLTGSSSFDITTQTTITIQSDGLEWQQIN